VPKKRVFTARTLLLEKQGKHGFSRSLKPVLSPVKENGGMPWRLSA
jgi:hypothetical protein